MRILCHRLLQKNDIEILSMKEFYLTDTGKTTDQLRCLVGCLQHLPFGTFKPSVCRIQTN